MILRIGISCTLLMLLSALDVLITNSFEALLLTEFLWLYFINHLPVILRRECF